MGTPQVEVTTTEVASVPSVQTEETKPSKSIDQLTREERAELNALSKDVYGASSRWQKLVNAGYNKLITEEVTEFVPAEKEGSVGTTRKVQVPVKRSDGALQSVLTRHTVDSIRAEMTDRKAKLEEIRAILKKQREDAKAAQELKQLSQKVQQELGGTAV